MIERRHCLVHGFGRRSIERRRPAQHDDFDSQCARRDDFAVACAAAAVLGDQRIDCVRIHQRTVISCTERSAIGKVAHLRQCQRRFHRIDAADQIKVLWRFGQGCEFGAAERDKHAAWPLAQSTHGSVDIDCFGPAVAGHRAPWRSMQRNQRHARLPCGGGGICRNNLRVRMRGVDEHVDAFLGKIIGKTSGAAEAARSNRHWLHRRRSGAAGQRHHDFQIRASGEPLGQFSRFRGTAEDQNA